MQLESGTLLAHYEITTLIGKGGMGEVYRARDTKLGRDVAIKVLPAEFTQDTERLLRFEREARLLASLDHSSIASIYGIEEVAGTRFLVMQLAEGEDLSALLRCPRSVEATLFSSQTAVNLAAATAWSASADHDRLAFIIPEDEANVDASSVVIVTDWFSRLKKLAPQTKR